MFGRLLPRTIDNTFPGQWLGLWLFPLLLLAHAAISLAGIFSPDGGAQSADGIPLNTFSAEAAGAVIGVIAYIGLARLLFDVIGVLALIRYRGMIPLLYGLMTVEFLAHKGIGFLKPIIRVAGTSNGSIFTLVLFALTLLGLVLSLIDGRRARAGDGSASVAN